MVLDAADIDRRTARVTIPVLVNRDGGSAAAMGDRLSGAIEDAFRAAGLAIDLKLLDGADIAAAARDRADAPLVVVGGGDGTLAAATGPLLSGTAVLGILPLGTRNHLARDLGIPSDLPSAARLIAERPTRRIDVARVNGHLFVNNASIGLYPDMVRRRDAEQRRLHVPKWLAALPASWSALKRLRHHRLHLGTPGGESDVVTPMLFVGNNRYALDAGRVGTRAALDDGLLCVLAVARRRRRALLGFALRTLAGRADPAHDFTAIGDCPSLTVAGRSHHIHVALDGEVVELRLPLAFTIQRRALLVVAPDDPARVSAAAPALRMPLLPSPPRH